MVYFPSINSEASPVYDVSHQTSLLVKDICTYAKSQGISLGDRVPTSFNLIINDVVIREQTLWTAPLG